LRILIVARRHDPHLSAVRWGLGKMGIEPSIWYWEDFPRSDLASFSISCEDGAAATLQLEKGQPQGGFDVVWLRRMGDTSAMPNAHPDDLETINSASEHFVRALLPYLGHANTRWVNEYYANDACENKLRQLAQAREHGFRIPDTLISNAPEAVRAFFDKHEGRIIHKSFAPALWNNADGSRTVAVTASISREQLRSEYGIQACPGIYQQKIEKKHELRVTVMGDSAIASAIYSQQDGPTTDWRAEGGRGVSNLRAIDMPPELERQCVDYCRKLGLAFGCIDLIVTPDDGIVFLEINRWGQFLFNEISDGTIPMLDAFCRFLAFGHARPQAGQPPAISMAEYFKSSDCQAAHEARMAAKKAA
jgi:glutathione synthase/RimK-type ligase-like ATP-grasp enzyme